MITYNNATFFAIRLSGGGTILIWNIDNKKMYLDARGECIYCMLVEHAIWTFWKLLPCSVIWCLEHIYNLYFIDSNLSMGFMCWARH